MHDPIERQAAIEALRTCYDTEAITYTNGNEYISYDQALDLINELPFAQPELVRCKDCKNRGDDDCPMRFIEWVEYDDDGYIEHDDIIHDYTKDDGFCDRAERRTDEGD